MLIISVQNLPRMFRELIRSLSETVTMGLCFHFVEVL